MMRLRRASAPQARRAVAMSDSLSKYWFQNIAPEIACTAEKLFFAFGESNSRLLLLPDERNEADEIGNLKEFVFDRPHILREVPFAAETCRHGFVDEICYGGLSAVIVNFNSAVHANCGFCGTKKSNNAGSELRNDLLLRGHELLVDTDATVAKWCFSGERHHRGEYPVAHLPAHVFVTVFPPDEWPGMKAKIGKPHSGQGVVEFADILVYLLLLIVGDKRHYVESGRIADNWKIAGFVDEYAQCSAASVHALENRERRCARRSRRRTFSASR